MAWYCYRFDYDKHTHFGPLEASSPDALYEKLALAWKWDKGNLVENAKRVWYWELVKKEDYLKMAPKESQKPLNFTLESEDAGRATQAAHP
jgi:hypothetical protein